MGDEIRVGDTGEYFGGKALVARVSGEETLWEKTLGRGISSNRRRRGQGAEAGVQNEQVVGEEGGAREVRLGVPRVQGGVEEQVAGSRGCGAQTTGAAKPIIASPSCR